MQHLTYCEAQWSIDVGFWQVLRSVKVNTWRLGEPLAVLRCGCTRPMLPCAAVTVYIDNGSLPGRPQGAHATSLRVTDVEGYIRNYNNLHDLEHIDGGSVLEHLLATRLVAPLFAPASDDEALRWARAPYLLPCLLTHVDAKNYRFAHREACAALALRSPLTIQHVTTGVDGLPFSESVAETLCSHGAALANDAEHCSTCPAFLAIVSGEVVTVLPFTPQRHAPMLCGDVEVDGALYVCLCDTSTATRSVSWAARSLLTCLRLAVPRIRSLHLYALRGGGAAHSVLFRLSSDALDEHVVRECIQHAVRLAARGECGTIGAAEEVADVHAVEERAGGRLVRALGWRSKRTALVDLASTLDVDRRAEVDSRLNLELMRWRVLPDLELTRLARCRALVLGVGSLGCAVARHLLMWGVRHLTLLDRGHVSYSNLARQSLFTAEDAKQRRGKAEAAAHALHDIMPTIDAQAEQLCIPMPGHRINEEESRDAVAAMDRLTTLIQAHDVVFLLTDSREARWLPTVVAAASGTPVINAALGFDTYLVMRHGLVTTRSTSNAVPPPPPPPDEAGGEERKGDGCQLGCYFCSDVVAPTDSTTMRTLDQQCTVTRPAVATIAAALAVELLAAVYQHPRDFRCAAPRSVATTATHGDMQSTMEKEAGVCRLGVIPHQLRGSVYTCTMQNLCGARSEYCTACSDAILDAYHTEGSAFLLRCINDPALIEQTCGVATLKTDWEATVRDIEWGDDDDDENADED